MKYNKDDLLKILEENKDKMLEKVYQFNKNLIEFYDKNPKYIPKIKNKIKLI